MNDGSVEWCILALRNAKNDTEKFAALMLCARLVQSENCDADQRKQLCRAIGFDFVDRLFETREQDLPSGCHPYAFRDLALSIYATFCTVPEFFTDHSSHMVEKVPVFLKLLDTYDSRTSEDEISVRNDAIRCLVTLSSDQKTCVSLVDQDSMLRLCEIFAKDDTAIEFRDQIFHIISSCAAHLGSDCWRRKPEAFNVLMNSLSTRMLNAKTQHKFVLCDVITKTFSSFPHELKHSCGGEKWYLDFHEELLSILCFKLGHAQREPLLKLCSAITEKLGVSWALNNINNNVNYEGRTTVEKSQRLFFLLVQLSCIEVRMILEDQCFDEILQKSELASACFVILEQAIRFLIDDDGQMVNQASQLQLYAAITHAISAVLYFFNVLSQRIVDRESWSGMEDDFLLAAIRILGSWLAEETMALREEIGQILPLLLKLCKTEGENNKKRAKLCLHFLLPGICHLVVEDSLRDIMIKEQLPLILLDLMSGDWEVVKEEVREDELDEAENKSEHDMNLVSSSSILLQLVILEGEKVREDPTYLKLLQFVFTALPHIDKRVAYLFLRGNFAVLGLLILRHHSQQVSGTNEVAIYRYLSASIRFLWDAFNVEDSLDGASLVVNRIYRSIWDQVREMWYLGMQALSELLTPMPWVGQFVVESGWSEEIVNMISKAQKSGVEASVKAAYEDFLCRLVSTYSEAAESLKICSAANMCKLHKMKELARLLRTSQIK